MNEMNESALILSAFENRLRETDRLSLTRHANKCSRWAEQKHAIVRESVESVR